MCRSMPHWAAHTLTESLGKNQQWAEPMTFLVLEEDDLGVKLFAQAWTRRVCNAAPHRLLIDPGLPTC